MCGWISQFEYISKIVKNNTESIQYSLSQVKVGSWIVQTGIDKLRNCYVSKLIIRLKCEKLGQAI